MTRIICLANSWKCGNRCIAGIHTIKHKWVRAISNLPDGGVPASMRLIDSREPALLDVIDIPLDKTGSDFGFECENLGILPGKWRLTGKVPPGYLLKFCSHEPYILHNDKRYVTVGYLQYLPFNERQTLQLVKTDQFSVECVRRRRDKSPIWEGRIVAENGSQLTASITDPVLVHKLELGYRPGDSCLVTVSLSMPWKPSDWEEDEQPCWKLIAGVIELPKG
ncbi:hypothetical protein [Lyngbya sp. PCC 8106]|uniref:dual OB domain-containing protein n=1 Tax=Lyngbya sp. (strain PCC 8106) TaxID=313612 RepID=UPI0000EAC62A|nr:hypothetical protein [Lyngbya sp. PCC 8106]EAW38449.1 hypothetical protein L8106_06599 [Lyngbya sp. PCC 8106]